MHTYKHVHTHQGSTQGWAAIPLRSLLDDIHIRRYWTWSHGGEECLLRSCDQSEEMNESPFLRPCMSAVHLAYQLWIIQSIIMSPETYPKKKKSLFFLLEFVLINPSLQLISKRDGMQGSFMYYNINNAPFVSLTHSHTERHRFGSLL